MRSHELLVLNLIRQWQIRALQILVMYALGISGTNLVFAADAPSPAEYGISIEEQWITMPDGVRLAADLYMPTGGSESEEFPVLLEYQAYRKVSSRGRNYPLYSYFVERGYIVARVDIRGTGNSEGRLIPYEYSDIELDDGEAIIEWAGLVERQCWHVWYFLERLQWHPVSSAQPAGAEGHYRG